MNYFSKDEKLISADEKSKILESLEQEFFNSSPSLYEGNVFKYQKKGIIIPAFIWLTCIIVSLATIFFVDKIKRPDFKRSINDVTMFNSNNASIFKTYKTEAEEEIKQKTEEVEFFQNKLEEYDVKLSHLRDLMNSNKAQSPDEAMTSEEIEEEIARIEQEKENVNLLIEEKIQEIDKVRDDSSLDETEDPFQEFARFQKLLNRESLISDQISSIYSLTLSSINSRDFEQAKTSITSLKTLINSDSMLEYPSIQKRKIMDKKIISFIETYIDINQLENGDSSETIKSDLISRAEIIIQNADNLTDIGDKTTAINFYRQGLETIPFIKNAENQLKILEEENKQNDYDQIISSAQESYNRGDQDEALNKYEEALFSLFSYKNINAETAMNNLKKIIEEQSLTQDISKVRSPAESEEKVETLSIEDTNYILFGIINSINSNLITIEKLSNLDVQEGKNISIRRYSAEGIEEPIADGVIISVIGETISAKIREESIKNEIMSGQDIVYIENEE